MTDTGEGSTARAAALKAFLASTSTGGAEGAPVVVESGEEVYAGGDVRRLLVRPASTLGYRLDDGSYQRAGAVPGDTVLVTAAQAKRLDAIGATVDPDELAEDTEEQPEEFVPAFEGQLADDAIRQGKAEDLVAYVGQYPDERARVRALEEERPEEGKGKRRVAVMGATEPTPIEDEEAKRLAEQQQGNDGGTTGE